MDATDLTDANRLLAEVQDIHRRTLDILDQPEGQDTALRAIREARGNLELFIKLRATLEPTDDLEELTTALLDVLQAHPEAHDDVVRVLERFEQSD